MKLLFIGDIVAKAGRDTVGKILPELKVSDNIDLVVANAENLAHGRGATKRTINETMGYGVDFFTGGDHIFRVKTFENEIDNLPVIRPANFISNCPGKGFSLLNVKGANPFLVINVLGSTLNNMEKGNFFQKIDEILESQGNKKLSGVLVDIHSDATSDKVALGHYLDGRVSAVCGTHTHVPTADARVLPHGTAYVTDVGMSGAINSVLGVKKEIIIDRIRNSGKERFEWEEEGPFMFNSVVIDINEETGRARSIERRDFIID